MFLLVVRITQPQLTLPIQLPLAFVTQPQLAFVTQPQLAFRWQVDFYVIYRGFWP